MIYIHTPFCKSFCTYCDFYSELCSGEYSQQVQNFVSGICEEISARKEQISAAASPDTLYVGGGTPSILPLSVWSGILTALGHPDPWEEFTMEVNPDDVDESKARGMKDLGVTRVSMGVQSLDDRMLRWMNRRHSAAHAVSAFHTLRDAGFANISLDLIFGISLMDDDTWEKTIRGTVALHPEHISAYQLSIEEGSTLADMVRNGHYEEAPDEKCRRQYEILCEILRQEGYLHYEISNFALPGKEAVHNSAYWSRKPYVGLGPGAHSFDGRVRSWNSQTLGKWTAASETLSDEEIREEIIMLALRTSRGIDASWLLDHSDAPAVKRMLRQGMLEHCDGRIRIPETKFFVSDEIIRDIV